MPPQSPHGDNITDRLILDGHNRTEACRRAGVEPTIYRGDDLTEYVIDANSSRRHMSTGARAMADALVLDADGRRHNGKWDGAKGRAIIRPESGTNAKTWKNLLAQAGLVLDYAPHLAEQVVDGNIPLDAAYREAQQAKDADRAELDRQARIDAEEAEAREFIEREAPDLAERVDGTDFQTFSEAYAVWEKRNREEAARIAREKAEQAAREKAERDNAEDRVRTMLGSLMRLESLAEPEQSHSPPLHRPHSRRVAVSTALTQSMEGTPWTAASTPLKAPRARS